VAEVEEILGNNTTAIEYKQQPFNISTQHGREQNKKASPLLTDILI